MARLTPKKSIREKTIFSDDEQTQKICLFAGDVEDVMEKYNIQNPVQLDVIIGSCMKFADAFTKKLKSGR